MPTICLVTFFTMSGGDQENMDEDFSFPSQDFLFPILARNKETYTCYFNSSRVSKAKQTM